MVDNRAGANGVIGTQAVTRARPDGHTLLVQYSGYHVGTPAVVKNLGWDPLKDLAPVALADGRAAGPARAPFGAGHGAWPN